MQSGTVAVPNVAEAIVDAEVVVGGQLVVLHPREGQQLGTLTQSGTVSPSPLFVQCPTYFAGLVLPIDYMP
jgi:hypothetical protein